MLVINSFTLQSKSPIIPPYLHLLTIYSSLVWHFKPMFINNSFLSFFTFQPYEVLLCFSLTRPHFSSFILASITHFPKRSWVQCQHMHWALWYSLQIHSKSTIHMFLVKTLIVIERLCFHGSFISSSTFDLICNSRYVSPSSRFNWPTSRSE